MAIKKKIIIRGKKVHDVGYRPFLLGIAESMEIDRFFADKILINKKQVVYALVCSSEENVKAFIEIASSKFPNESDVEKVDVEDYEGNVMKAESYYRYLTAMQLSKIGTYGGRMLEKQDNTLEKQDSMLGKMDTMTEKQDSMLGKMDTVIEKQSETTEEIKEVSGRIYQNREETVSEIRSLRSDLKSYFDERLIRLELEVAQIKAKVCA
jgi:acylphosphatase